MANTPDLTPPVTVDSYVLKGIEAVPVTVTAQICADGQGVSVNLPEAPARELRAKLGILLKKNEVEGQAIVTVLDENGEDIPAHYSTDSLELPAAMACFVAADRGRLREVTKVAKYAGRLNPEGAVQTCRGLNQMAREAEGYLVCNPIEPLTAYMLQTSMHNELAGLYPAPKLWFKAVDSMPDMADCAFGDAFLRQVLAAVMVGKPVILSGKPGSGKTMLAGRLGGLVDFTEGETSRDIFSACRLAHGGRIPFRAPHHTASAAGLVGGGSGSPRPGEATLSHGGVLFLDEVPEFSRQSLDYLKRSLAEGKTVLHKATGSVVFPAKPALTVGAFDPETVRAGYEVPNFFRVFLEMPASKAPKPGQRGRSTADLKAWMDRAHAYMAEHAHPSLMEAYLDEATAMGRDQTTRTLLAYALGALAATAA